MVKKNKIQVVSAKKSEISAAASTMPPRYDSPEHWDAARAQEDLDFHMKHEGVGGPMPEERKPGRRGKLSFMDKEQIDFIRFGECRWIDAKTNTIVDRNGSLSYEDRNVELGWNAWEDT